MKKSVVETIERMLDRRSFVRKTALVTGALISGLIAAPKEASAKTPCCGLCHVPGTPPWPGSGCYCVWCWTCKSIDCVIFKCMECFTYIEPPCVLSLCQCYTSLFPPNECRTCEGVYASKEENLGPYFPCTPK
jgi:hypothetical protein